MILLHHFIAEPCVIAGWTWLYFEQ